MSTIPVAAITLVAMIGASNSFLRLPLSFSNFVCSGFGGMCAGTSALGQGLAWGMIAIVFGMFVYVFVITEEIVAKSRYVQGL